MEWTVVLLVLWIGVPVISYVFFWYEVANCSPEECGSSECPGSRSLLRSLIPAMFSSVLALPLVLLLYPFGWVTRWWNVTGGAVSRGTVIFLHGLCHNPSAVVLMKRGLVSRGFSLLTPWYTPWEGTVETVAHRIADELASRLAVEPPQKAIVVVGHSLGGILATVVARTLYERGHQVRAVITLGTPFLGSKMAVFLPWVLARSIRWRSPLLARLVERAGDLPCTAVQLWSPTDNMVLPLTSLSQVPPGWRQYVTSPLCHMAILFAPSVRRKVMELIESAVFKGTFPHLP